MLKKHLATLALATAGFLVTGSAQGAFQLLQFQPNPISPTVPEFSWTGAGGNFVDAAGSHGALEVDVPLVVATPAGTNGTSNVSVPLTTFMNASLTFSDSGTLTSPDLTTFQDAGAAVIGGNAYQALSNGSFSLTATDGTVLLNGTISQNSLTVPLGGSASGFEGGQVTYTGGLIYNALIAAGYSPSGDTSISMTTVDGNPISVNLNTPSIGAFNANATGVFDVNVPEPASLGAVALIAVLGCRRRRV